MNGNRYPGLVIFPHRATVTLVVVAWIVVAAHASAAPRPGAIVWKKGSGGQGEKISAREFLQFTTKTSIPSYREDDRINRFTGTGIFDLRIDPSTGETTGIRIFKSTGHDELDASALKALINWRFKPGLVRVVFPLTFAHNKNPWPRSPQGFLERDLQAIPRL
jgi:TonB family protein